MASDGFEKKKLFELNEFKVMSCGVFVYKSYTMITFIWGQNIVLCKVPHYNQ